MDAVLRIREGKGSPSEGHFDEELATIYATLTSTAILEAGRLSLDKEKPLRIVYDKDGITPLKLELE